jgi:Transcriptional regulator
MGKALETGLSVLEFISSKRSCTATEAAEALGINKSTASRVINTFIKRDMVEKNKSTGMYSVGPAILRMSNRYFKARGALGKIKAAMEFLMKRFGESLHLCALANDDAVVIEQSVSDSRLIVNAKIGNREPLHASAVGKCLLAFAAEEDRNSMLSHIAYARYTDNTITDEKTLLGELEKIRGRGYSEDLSELTPEIRCVAVPVFDSRGKCVYSLGVSGARSGMTEEKVKFIVETMTETLKELKIEN